MDRVIEDLYKFEIKFVKVEFEDEQGVKNEVIRLVNTYDAYKLAEFLKNLDVPTNIKTALLNSMIGELERVKYSILTYIYEIVEDESE